MQCRVPADRVVRSHYRYVPRLAAPSEGPLPAVSAMLTYVPTADAGDAAYRRHETNVETITVTQNLTRPAHTHAHAAPKPMAVVAAQLRLDARILMLTHTKHAESALLAAARLADRAERDEGLYHVKAAITHACCAAAAESESVLRQMVELSVVDMLVPGAYTVPPHSPSHGVQTSFSLVTCALCTLLTVACALCALLIGGVCIVYSSRGGVCTVRVLQVGAAPGDGREGRGVRGSVGCQGERRRPRG